MRRTVISLRDNFVVGFIAILPLALSLWIFFQLVGIVVGITDKVLVFLPEEVKGSSWHPFWRIWAFLVSIAAVTLLGFVARNVLGKTVLNTLERIILRVPMLNKIYGGIKQIVEGISSSQKGAFKSVLLVRFPHRDSYVIAFLTAESKGEVQERTAEEVINVFVPTTPNPTSGFLLMVPKRDTIPLQMSVTDAVKLVISGGAVTPPPPAAMPAPSNGNP